MIPGCDVATPVATVVVPRYRLVLVNHRTAKVINTMVTLVSSVRNLRRLMFAIPSSTALISTPASANDAPCDEPRPDRNRFSSVSNFPYTTKITRPDIEMIANARTMISGLALILKRRMKRPQRQRHDDEYPRDAPDLAVHIRRPDQQPLHAERKRHAHHQQKYRRSNDVPRHGLAAS